MMHKTFNMNQAQNIKKFLVKQVVNHQHNLVNIAANHFNVSRTTILRHINTLVNNGILIKTGKTKQITYILAQALKQTFTFNLNKSFDEFQVVAKHISPIIKKYVNSSCLDICEYTLTEMLNNARDHSYGEKVILSFEIKNKNIIFSCQDNGLGVFSQLQKTLGFNDAYETMLQLSKGKVTSDAINHSGEGLFFTCRAVDEFTLLANNFCFLRDNTLDDWSFYQTPSLIGTKIQLVINKQTNRCLQEVFKQYQDNDTMQFTKTQVLIDLAKEHGARLISRSQAKRVVAHLEQFNDITFDFKHVKIVGQGFIDQLFRVFQKQRPSIKLHYINANTDVEFMIKRGINH